MDHYSLCWPDKSPTLLSSYPHRLLAGKTWWGKMLNEQGSFYDELENFALTEDFPPYPWPCKNKNKRQVQCFIITTCGTCICSCLCVSKEEYSLWGQLLEQGMRSDILVSRIQDCGSLGNSHAQGSSLYFVNAQFCLGTEQRSTLCGYNQRLLRGPQVRMALASKHDAQWTW